MNYDGTGFAIGFGADYQILRAPEEDTQYVWVVSFTELSKTGTGSRPRLVNTPIKLQDSGSLRVVVPLQGQPKGPFKCMVAAKKGGRIQRAGCQLRGDGAARGGAGERDEEGHER